MTIMTNITGFRDSEHPKKARHTMAHRPAPGIRGCRLRARSTRSLGGKNQFTTEKSHKKRCCECCFLEMICIVFFSE